MIGSTYECGRILTILTRTNEIAMSTHVHESDDDIVNRVRSSITKNFHVDNDNNVLNPWVCIVCDSFLTPHQVNFISKARLEECSSLLSRREEEMPLHSDVEDYYTYRGEGTSDILKKCLLSPKGLYATSIKDDRNRSTGRSSRSKKNFVICVSCRSSLYDSKTPMFAIANSFTIGEAPEVLKELNDVELAFISAVRCHTHVLSFYGGHSGIKGFHSFLKMDVAYTRRVLEQMDRIPELPNKVVVIIMGDFTDGQKREIMKDCEIRRDKCKDAIDWLNENNIKHAEYNIDLDNLSDPLILDFSKEIESRDANIEKEKQLTIVFPDATLDNTTGGYETVDEYKRVIDDLLRGDFVAQVNVPNSSYVRDYEEDNLVLAFPRHFPYGYGGPNERRCLQNGSYGVLPREKYFKHVVNLSNLCFQEALFLLVAFNIVMRQRMLNSVSWRINANRGSVAERIANAVPEPVIQEMNRRNNREQQNQTVSTYADPNSRQFLDSIHLLTKAMPHTNEAAQKARNDLQSMQIKHGQPHLFITVSPSDDNSMILNVYGKLDNISTIDLNTLSPDEIRSRATERDTFRFKYPGLSTLNFERLLHIIKSDIIGWGRTSIKGLFGEPLAYFFAVEEQARKTLHVHILLWIKDLPYKISDLLSTRRQTAKLCESYITSYVDKISSTDVLGEKIPWIQHICANNNVRKTKVTMKNCQCLRNLRHKEGCRTEHGAIAFCGFCQKQWTAEELNYEILSTNYNVNLFNDQLTMADDPTLQRRLRHAKAKSVEILLDSIRTASKNQTVDNKRIGRFTNAVYDCHSGFHAKTCFKERRKRKRTECRYYLPQQANKRTKVVPSESPVIWYMYTGEKKEIPNYNVVIKRPKFDVMTNTYCPVISQCLMCNSNVSVVINGPHCFYVTKYAPKPTQEEDNNDYVYQADWIHRRLSCRRFEEDHREALSRLLGASIVHNGKNVISATMAKFLINNTSRFQLSDTIYYIPISEMRKVLKSDSFVVRLSHYNVDDKNEMFLESYSHHYLLRPKELEKLTLYDFTKYYEVKRFNKTTINKELDIEEEYEFPESHPGHKLQCIRKRAKEITPGINNYFFPCSSKFEGNILNNDTQITPIMEEYAEVVLIVFCSYRNQNDLKIDNSYVKKFRDIYYNSEIKIRMELDCFLQHIQDIRNGSNISTKLGIDELGMNTTKFKGTDETDCVDDDSDDEIDNEYQQQMLEYLNQELLHPENFENSNFIQQTNTSDLDLENQLPQSISLATFKDKGAHRCGYDLVCEGNVEKNDPFQSSLIEYDETDPDNEHNNDTDQQNNRNTIITKQQLYTLVILSRQCLLDDSNQHTTIERTNDTSLNFDKKATGTIESIREWITDKNFDENQSKAFITICAHFILTFYDEADKDVLFHNVLSEQLKGEITSSLLEERKKLERVTYGRDHLRLFMDGPGGSGKSEVIKNVIRYSARYCKNLHVPFTRHTILMTASTGVAATLINGTTVHASLKLNNKLNQEIKQEMQEIFKQTRLIVLDEISMIDIPTLKKIDANLREFGNPMEYYGGFNIIFAGDFRQLEPVGKAGQAIYCDRSLPVWNNAINSYVELQGMYRFKEDEEWGHILRRFREGIPTQDDFDKINRRVVDTQTKCTLDNDKIPDNIVYATPANKERDAINNAVFHNVIRNNPEDAIVILSDKIAIKMKKDKKGKYEKLTNPDIFWKYCSEDDCKTQGTITRLDPMLKLYKNCPVMLVSNESVANNKANGTRGFVDTVKLKPRTKVHTIKVDNIDVKAIFASDVAHIQLRLEQQTNLETAKVQVGPRQQTGVKVRFPKPPHLQTSRGHQFIYDVSVNQLPLVVNHATTGHKLQGCTTSSIFVNCFSYRTNWPYVVLSRVKTMKGLFLRKPLDPRKDYSIHVGLARMTNELRHTKTIPDDVLNM